MILLYIISAVACYFTGLFVGLSIQIRRAKREPKPAMRIEDIDVWRAPAVEFKRKGWR